MDTLLSEHQLQKVQTLNATRQKPIVAQKGKRGAAAVEFALVAPLLFLMIVLPIFEFSRSMMVSELITNAARTGARIGILPGNTNTAVLSAINANLASHKLNGATTTIAVNGSATDVGSASPGDVVTVTVTIPYNNISWTRGAYMTNLKITGSQSLCHE